MSRGFNPTLGAGTTDEILSAYTGSPTQRTIAVLANRRVDTTGARRIFSKQSATTFDMELDHTNAAATYDLFVEWDGTPGQWSWARPTVATWTQLALTYDGGAVTNDPVMYYDGTVQSITQVGANPSGAKTTSLVWAIGNRHTDLIRAWDGMLAEFAVWNRILTPTEIASLIVVPGAIWRAPTFIPSGLVEYLPMRAGNDGLAGTPIITGTAVQTHPTVLTSEPLAYAVLQA